MIQYIQFVRHGSSDMTLINGKHKFQQSCWKAIIQNTVDTNGGPRKLRKYFIYFFTLNKD